MRRRRRRRGGEAARRREWLFATDQVDEARR
jgi:hypothetical protein